MHRISRRSLIRGLGVLVATTATAGVSRWPVAPWTPGATDSPGAIAEEPAAEVPAAMDLPEASPIPEAADVASPTATPAVPRLVKAPDLVGREGWRAVSARGPYRFHEPRRVTLHHTAVAWTGGDTVAHLRGIQQFHLGSERRWVDIAYHYLIDRDGTIYVGRPESAEPDTATVYDTAGHLGICVLGDFDRQRPAAEQLSAASGLIAWLMDRYSLPVSTLGGHRDYAATSCPGANLHALLADGSLAAEVSRLLG